MNSETSTLSLALHDAVTESLENMFLSEVADVSFNWGSVRVSEPFEGKVTVAFPRDLTAEIVNEIYGVERKDITDDVISDIISEVANTVAGRLINTLVDPDETFKLHVPEAGSGPLIPNQDISFISHFEMNHKIYLVMLEGESLLKFKDKKISLNELASGQTPPEESSDDDAWG